MKLIVLFYIFLLFSGCAKNGGTSTGNPLVSIKYQNFNQLLSTFVVNQINFCFKRVRFKKINQVTNPEPSLDNDNLDFEIGEKQISQSGGILGDIRVPIGIYTRVEFDLDNHCANSYSVNIINSNGTFLTNERITIKFEGYYKLESDSELFLSMQPLINALDTVNNSDSIKSNLENASGSF